jgi:uncharacterized protein (TIGR03083 family)
LTSPDSSEYASYYEGYVSKVPEGDILAVMRSESERTAELLSALSPEQADHRYEEGKWSVKEVVGHLIDTERMFGYRAHCFAREDPAPLAGFEQDDYARSSNAGGRSLQELVDELRAVRQSNLALFRGLDDAMWSRRGMGSGCEFTVRALAYIIVGHELHHRGVLESRYL